MAGQLAIIGTGRMGGALVKALLERGGYEADQIVCTAQSSSRRSELAELHGVHVTADNRAAVANAATVVLALKPQVLREQLAAFGDAVHASLVISVAAGITTSAIEAYLPAHTAVVRAMPNTPLLVGQGMTAIAAGQHASASQVSSAAEMFATAGMSVVVDESAMDAVTAVSGSGPAYVFLLAESMIAAAQKQGLDADTATTLVSQTLTGAAAMLNETLDPVRLREQVTSPGGTTAAALTVFDEADLRGIVARAVSAAYERSVELGQTQ